MSAKTVKMPFGLGDTELFSIQPDVPAEKALGQVMYLLATAADVCRHCCDSDMKPEAAGVLIELAMNIVDACQLGMMTGTERGAE